MLYFSRFAFGGESIAKSESKFNIKEISMKKLLLSSVIVAVGLNAANLAQEAKDFGLLPLPSTQSEIDAYLKSNGIKASAFSTAKA